MPTLISQNPFTEEVNATFETLSETEVIKKIEHAYAAYLSWKNTSNEERKMLFLALSDELEKDIDLCARLQTIEMGMLYHQSRSGIEKTISLIRWFANNSESILAPREYMSEWMNVLEMHDPIGVIFWVAPWNFPFNQLLRAAVPNILAGNTQLYKHSSNVPLVALKIQELFDRAGFPNGVYTNLFVPSSMSEIIIAHKYIAWVNLTGSEKAGQSVWALAGKYLKPSVLELGGNDAFVVLEDSDIDKVIELAVNGRIRNGGQACNASKRFIIPSSIYTLFLDKYTHAMQSLVIGDPMLDQTQLQPLSSKKAVHEIEEQVARAITTGARLITGGKGLVQRWFFFPPTILANVTHHTSSYNEEIFGPVASVMQYETIEEAIELANGTDFWLSAVVIGNDRERIIEVAKKLDGGMIFLNENASSRASLPFGWVKKSWYGKENGSDGLLTFTNKKIIVFSNQ